jgi:hypothetical protein
VRVWRWRLAPSRQRVAWRRGAAVPGGERKSTMAALARPPRDGGAPAGAVMNSGPAWAQMGLGGPVFLASEAGERGGGGCLAPTWSRWRWGRRRWLWWCKWWSAAPFSYIGVPLLLVVVAQAGSFRLRPPSPVQLRQTRGHGVWLGRKPC